jgi:hypothetical protein
MPGPVTVIAEETTPPDVEPSDGEGTGDGRGQEVVEEAAMVPAPEPAGRPRGAVWSKPDPDSAADYTDMLCSGYILPEEWESDIYFYAAEEDQKVLFGPGDILYINQGLANDVQPGDKFYVVHQENKVKHPVTGDLVGYYVRKTAVAQVIAAQEETATVELLGGGCEGVHLGYDLIRYSELTSPKRRETGLERYGVEDNGNISGYVVFAQPDKDTVGEGDIVYIDLGMADGVEKGDYLMIYRERLTDQKPNEAGLPRIRYKHKSSVPAYDTRALPRGKEMPRKMLGEMVILASNHHTATAKVMYSWREIYLGDQVQLLD